MADWSEGYVTEIDYTYGFYKEMAPASIRFALNAAGYDAPSTERFNYCELGFGQGAGLNLMAASHPKASFWGTDFNPAHAAGALKIAQACGVGNLNVFDDSFEEFTRRDLPKFDYIALHGIWSWVSTENRRHLVDFISKHLNAGGVVYVSYNTLPGWSHALPLRGLLSQYVEHQAPPSAAIASRFDEALKLLVELNEVPGSYFKLTPQLAERIKVLQTQNKNYLVHEYLNGHWTPMFFTQVVEELQAAKLTFAAHANVLNCIDALCHTKELQAILNRINGPLFREVVRDYGINQTFRRDLHVRGPRRLTREEHAANLLDTAYVLTQPRKNCTTTIKTQIGEAQLQATVYEPLFDALASGPRTGRSLLESAELKSLIDPPRLLQALVVAVGAGYAAPCAPAAQAKEARASVHRFNDYIMSRSARTPEGELLFLASPMLNSGVGVSRTTQLMLRGLRENPKADPAAIARHVWATLRQYNQVLVKDGTNLTGDAANLEELTARVTDWLANEGKMLRNLDMI